MPRCFLSQACKMLLATNRKDKLLTIHTTNTNLAVRGKYKGVNAFQEYKLPLKKLDVPFLHKY